MNTNYRQLKHRVTKDRTTKDMLGVKLVELKESKISLKAQLKDAEMAREIVQVIAQKTLQNLEFHISSLVSIALSAVFPDPPEFVARISIRRNQTEVDLFFSEYGKEQKPLESDGYGAVDIASYALRVSFWSLRRTRPVMILDEPFKFVSPDLHHKVSEMVKMISEKLGLQHIIVSHQEDVNINADRTFHTEKVGKRSRVVVT